MKQESVKMFEKMRMKNLKILDNIFKRITYKKAFITMSKQKKATFHQYLIHEHTENLKKINKRNSFEKTEIKLKNSYNTIIELCAMALKTYYIENDLSVRIKKPSRPVPECLILYY